MSLLIADGEVVHGPGAASVGGLLKPLDCLLIVDLSLLRVLRLVVLLFVVKQRPQLIHRLLMALYSISQFWALHCKLLQSTFLWLAAGLSRP